MESTIGPEGNLLDPRPESCRQIKIEYPIIDNDQLAKLRHVYDPGFRADPHSDAVRPRRRMATASSDALDDLNRRAAGAVDAGYTILILSDRDADRDARADSEPAGDGRRAPSSGPPGHAHALRARRRDGRRARSASLRAAARLRRRRGQPVPGVRDARRHDPAADSRRRHAREGGQELHQGAQQGHPQGDVQDGHLDAAELLRRADVRSDRPRARRSSTSTSRARRRASAASASTSSPRKCGGGTRRRSRRGRSASTISSGAASTSGGATANTTCSTPTRSSSCSTRRAAASTRSSRSTRGWSTTRAQHLATLRGLLELKTAGDDADSDRRGRAGRGDRQALRHRRDVVRLDQPGSARDAGDRHEPHRRQVEHRRRRRRSGALHARCERRLAAQRRSSRWPRRASA